MFEIFTKAMYSNMLTNPIEISSNIPINNPKPNLSLIQPNL